MDFATGTVFGRTHSHEATHESFGPIKALFQSIQRNKSPLYHLLQSKGLQLFGENVFGVHSIVYPHVGDVLYVFAAFGLPLVTGNLPPSSLPITDHITHTLPFPSLCLCIISGTEISSLSPPVPRWYSWKEVQTVASLLGLALVPVLHEGTFESSTSLKYFLDKQAEGPTALSDCPCLHHREEAVAAPNTDCAPVRPEGFVVRVARGFPRAHFSECVAKVCVLGKVVNVCTCYHYVVELCC